jgi:hypothetical protein
VYVPLISTILHLNNAVLKTCECKGCNFPATRNCRTIPLPDHVSLCAHCAIDLEWHGVIEEIWDNKDGYESGVNKGSKGKVEI